MSTAPNLRDVIMSKTAFTALTDAIDHQRRSLAALRACEHRDSVAVIVIGDAVANGERTLRSLVGMQHRCVVK